MAQDGAALFRVHSISLARVSASPVAPQPASAEMTRRARWSGRRTNPRNPTVSLQALPCLAFSILLLSGLILASLQNLVHPVRLLLPAIQKFIKALLLLHLLGCALFQARHTFGPSRDSLYLPDKKEPNE